MPISEAKKRANKKWNDANLKSQYDRIQLVVPKGVKSIIDEYAKKKGESVNGLMNRLLMAELRASPEEWKRADISLPEADGKPETGLEVMKRLAAEAQEQKEQGLKEEAARRDMMAVFREDMSDNGE